MKRTAVAVPQLPLLGLKEDTVRPIRGPVQQGLRRRNVSVSSPQIRLEQGGGTADTRPIQKGAYLLEVPRYMISKSFEGDSELLQRHKVFVKHLCRYLKRLGQVSHAHSHAPIGSHI